MTNRARDLDYKIASLLLYVSQAMDFMRLARIDYEVFTSIALLSHEGYRAISVRGACVGDLVEALRKIAPGGSMLKDLPISRGGTGQGPGDT